MRERLKRPSGGRLYQRPDKVEICRSCGAPIGRNYKECKSCYNAIENIWLSDWNELIQKENISQGSEEEKLLAHIVFEQQDRYSWTLVDIAMTMIHCDTCGGEIGGGELECLDCKFAFENLWGYDVEAMNQGIMTENEHALRVGRRVLRHSHRQKKNIVKSWKFSMPIVLANELPSNRQAGFFKKIIDENKFDLSSKVYQNFEEAYIDVINNIKE
ncbi:hypothetical protein [Sporosalibacterium faouarense]|uniref:hypothetical protein n=1 Tax=Sporosalibacterium faouarense TaxID=516123 RepID=UPI00141C6469|nr:hypothetical protein [Sporosalibacterium faouarense]MTI49949.1 hypothetical protein [Bacillota bacterium]